MGRTRELTRILIGLGASAFGTDPFRGMQDARRRMLSALDGVRAEFLEWKCVRVSSIYRSERMGPDGASVSDDIMLNACLEVYTLDGTVCDPVNSLRRLKALETRLGRVQRERWGPREIDLDLLCWDGQCLQTADLQLPHPGIQERPFVLLPLLELIGARALREILGDETTRRAQDWERSSVDSRPYRVDRVGLSWTEVFGVLNLTPDSFSDGGRVWFSNQPSLERELARWIDSGVDGVDIGAESTRPGAGPVAEEQEWTRLQAFLDLLRSHRPQGLALSLDSRHVKTQSRAREYLPDLIMNDVGGLNDPEMWALAQQVETVWAMHSVTVPASVSELLPADADPVEPIGEWADQLTQRWELSGKSRSKLWLDAGIGFGKSSDQSWRLVRQVSKLHRYRTPVAVGHSRKRLLMDVPGSNPNPVLRDAETMALSLELAKQGTRILRVHAGKETVQALRAQARFGGAISLCEKQ